MNVMLNPVVNFDELNNKYTISIKELETTACSNTFESAVDILIEKIGEHAFTFFDNIPSYYDNSYYEFYYDYFIGLSGCTSRCEVIEMLGLKN